jgi:SOS-response transcriptional repressor LexA
MDFSLVYEKDSIPHVKQVFIEGRDLYLKPLNTSLKTALMSKNQKFIGVLIQAKKDFL